MTEVHVKKHNSFFQIFCFSNKQATIPIQSYGVKIIYSFLISLIKNYILFT